MNEADEKALILESLAEGVIAVDEEMNITYVNSCAERFLDIKKGDFLNRHIGEIGMKEFITLLNSAKAKHEATTALIKMQKKSKKYFDAIAAPMKGRGAILVLQDKTGLHKVVEKGRDFVANASHELKTPITIIRGFAETLHDHPELTREVAVEITQKILNNCERMEILIRNLLTLAALDEGIPFSRLHSCDLTELAEKAKQTVLNIHPKAEISIATKGEEKITILGDKELLFQAFLNLMDNAAKYSKPPAEINILIEKDKNSTRVIIADKGIGIAQSELERIFERFYAVDKSHSRTLGGSGLGLSIVESIIEKHQGKIEVSSKVGKGTTFTLLFPNKNNQ